MNNPFIIIIFGASGDLTERKLIPALFDLYKLNELPDKFKILGTGRTQIQDSEFRIKQKGELKKIFSEKDEIFDQFLNHLFYTTANPQNLDSFNNIKESLDSLSKEFEYRNYLFYFALPPQIYGTTAENLYKSGLLAQDSGWRRVIIEKPFGRDLESALDLSQTLLNYLSEEQIYRIDHYLGKETVQNIFVTRFSNTIFEPLWNRNYIDYIEITSSEALSVGSRGGYYDHAGALRDMLQNHLLQLLALIAMEPPISSEANAIRDETVKVFKSLKKINQEEVKDYVVRGQYTASKINGEEIKGYLQESGIAPNSTTETFIAMECYIDNWRWNGVPFYIRTGKSLPARVTEVAIHFKATPYKILKYEHFSNEKGNQLIIRIQPDDGVQFKIGMKRPGGGFTVEPVNMDFKYESLKHYRIPEAYERLICDCINGDATLYQREDAVKVTWEYVQPILNAWKENLAPIFNYPAGSWGPSQANLLTEKNGHTWRQPCKNLSGSDQFCEL